MAYQTPYLAYRHALREAGAGALSVETGTIATGVEGRLIDNLGERFLQVTADAGVVEIDGDLSALSSIDFDRFLHPAGHNWDGADLEIRQDDNSGFTSHETVYGPTAVSGSGLIDVALSPAVTEDYVRIRLTSAPTTVDLGELVVTDRFSLSVGIDPRWRDPEPEEKLLEEETQSGVVVVSELAPPRRVVKLVWNRLPAPDFTLLDGLRTAIGVRRDPFWLWPPDDSQSAVWVRLTQRPRSPQESPVPPVTGPEYGFSLQGREVIG